MTRRMIISEMWEDDFFVSLSMIDRLIWIGIISACADDQGRLQDNANLIKSKVFPLDSFNADNIEAALKRFCKADKILRYTAGGKKIIQIISWWKHQTPQWAGHSILPAPDGWIDRERFHGKGNKIIITNWDKTGGYLVDYIAVSPSSDVNGDVNGDVNVKDTPPQIFIEADLVEYQQVFEKDTGLSTYRIDQAFEVWSKMKADGVTPQDMHQGTQELLHSDKTYTIVRPQSVMNAAYTAKQKRVYEESKRIPEIAKPVVSLEECLRLEKLNEERYNNA